MAAIKSAANSVGRSMTFPPRRSERPYWLSLLGPQQWSRPTAIIVRATPRRGKRPSRSRHQHNLYQLRQYDLRPSAARFLTVLPIHKAELVEATAKAFTITGIADCCAPATSGHTAAAPPSSVMNLRRFTRLPRRRGRAAAAAHRARAPLL